MRVVGEVEARRGVGRIPTDVDPERTDLPVTGNRAHQEEHQDQRPEEEQKAEPPAPTFGLPARAGDAADRNDYGYGLRDGGGAGLQEGWDHGLGDGRDDGLDGRYGYRFGDGFDDGLRDGVRSRCRGCGGGIRLGRFRPAGQPGQALMNLCLVGFGSGIGRSIGTPGS